MIDKLFISELQAIFGANSLLTQPAECLAYSYDNSRLQYAPEAVAFAENAEQIQKTVQLCNQYQVPLTVRGRGTNTTGATVPVHGGLVLSCERMRRIIKLDIENRLMTVEPGVLNQEVQIAAKQAGFFWAPDPSSAAYCTIGGNIACNAAGPRAVKYGATRENTLHLTAITGAGELIHTGTYTTKGAVGYDLTRLLIGSEGTLAIITEAVLKLTPLPEAKATLRVLYRDTNSATRAIVNIMAQAVTPSALEYMDAQAIQLIREQGVAIVDDARALLLIEIDGLASALPALIEKVSTAASNDGLLEIKTATDATQAENLWAARKALSPALRNIAPQKINEDVVVPLAALADLLHGLAQLAKQYKITIVNFGHAGNGNIHVNLLTDFSVTAQRAQALQCLDEVFNLVLKLKGSLSGEHGIGVAKRDFIAREIDATTLALARQIKTVFDPRGILNPGKIFPVL